MQSRRDLNRIKQAIRQVIFESLSPNDVVKNNNKLLREGKRNQSYLTEWADPSWFRRFLDLLGRDWKKVLGKNRTFANFIERFQMGADNVAWGMVWKPDGMNGNRFSPGIRQYITYLQQQFYRRFGAAEIQRLHLLPPDGKWVVRVKDPNAPAGIGRYYYITPDGEFMPFPEGWEVGDPFPQYIQDEHIPWDSPNYKLPPEMAPAFVAPIFTTPGEDAGNEQEITPELPPEWRPPLLSPEKPDDWYPPMR